MDAFSEVLNGVRLKGAMFFRAEFSAPWRLWIEPARWCCALAEGRDKGPLADARRRRWGDDLFRVWCDPLLCGPILESLPPMLRVNIRTDRAGQWLEAPRAWRGEFDNHRGTAARNLDVDVQITHRNAVYGIAGADDQPHRLPSQDPND